MILENLVTPALETLVEQIQNNQLLLIHPRSRVRLLLLAALLEFPPCPLYYHQLRVTDTSLDSFLTGLVYGLAEQTPGFGYHLTSVLRETPGDLGAVAAAVARDLAAIAQDDYLLILDDFDYCDASPGFFPFFERLFESLPVSCHLLISSRTIPPLPWIALIARRRATIIRGGLPSNDTLSL